MGLFSALVSKCVRWNSCVKKNVSIIMSFTVVNKASCSIDLNMLSFLLTWGGWERRKYFKALLLSQVEQRSLFWVLSMDTFAKVRLFTFSIILKFFLTWDHMRKELSKSYSSYKLFLNQPFPHMFPVTILTSVTSRNFKINFIIEI